MLNQILRPIQRFPQCLKSVRIIAFAFFLDGGVSKAAFCGAETFDGIVPNPERFREGVFQDFALCIERLLGRRRNRYFGKIRENGLSKEEAAPGRTRIGNLSEARLSVSTRMVHFTPLLCKR